MANITPTTIMAAGGGYAGKRVPAILRTRDYWLLFAEGRIESNADAAHTDLILSRVPHAGLTTWTSSWSLIVDDGSNGNPGPGGVTLGVCGASSAVYLPDVGDQGRVLVTLARMPYGLTSSTQDPGIEGDTTTCWTLTSDDQGATWAEPVDITAQVKDPAWYNFVIGPGNGLVLHSSGRICGIAGYTPTVASAGAAPIAVHSDDGGTTWAVTGAVAARNTTIGSGFHAENQLCELDDGSLLALCRHNQPDAQIAARFFRSTDRGATWTPWAGSAAQPIVPAVTCGLATAPLAGADRRLVLWSRPGHNARDTLVIQASLARGGAWQTALVADDDTTGLSTAYTAIAHDPDDDSFLVVNEPLYSSIEVSRVTLDWLGIADPGDPPARRGASSVAAAILSRYGLALGA